MVKAEREEVRKQQNSGCYDWCGSVKREREKERKGNENEIIKKRAETTKLLLFSFVEQEPIYTAST